ncbi:MAG: head-tail joining protein [Desulfobacterales bacterium]
MSFDDDVSRMLDKIYDADRGMAKAATFTPQAGDPVACLVLLEEEASVVSAEAFSAWQQMTTIEARLSEIGAEPSAGDVFTVGSVDYAVRQVLENDGYTVKVQV